MDDYISRQAAIDALCSVCGVDCDKSKFVYDGKQKDQVILCPEHYALTQLPSAQPERILARWEKQVLGWKCSNCTASTNDFGAREFNFCPACGAYMRGGR